MMVKEVLKYTLTAPYTFLSGLIVISEMLPLPLPVQTREVSENFCFFTFFTKWLLHIIIILVLSYNFISFTNVIFWVLEITKCWPISCQTVVRLDIQLL